MQEDEARAHLEEVNQELHDLEELHKSRGWALCVRMLEEQGEAMLSKVIQPLQSMDETLEEQYHKGELFRIQTFPRMVEAEIGRLKRDRELIKEEWPKLFGGDRNETQLRRDAP